MMLEVLLALSLGGITDFSIIGWQRDPALTELSGLASSRLVDGRFWALNDGGQPAELYSVRADGTVEGKVTVAGVPNIDWEDIASFTWKGKPYLMIADIGDNAAIRDHILLHVVHEPRALGGSTEVAWTLRVRYPDRAHDAEGIAVDVEAGKLLLLDKRITPSSLYQFDLRPRRDGKIQVAEVVGTLGGIPEVNPSETDQDNFTRYANQTTGLDLSCDRQELAVLTYAAVYRYRKKPGQNWAQALATPFRRDALPPVVQIEAIAYSKQCEFLLIGSEKPPVPMLRLDMAE
jgi:hypothetical protein